MKTLRRSPQVAYPEPPQKDCCVIPPVNEEQLQEICRRIGDNKAPSLDCIPNIPLKVAAEARPDFFASTFEACLKEKAKVAVGS